jgi:hypothetical protein
LSKALPVEINTIFNSILTPESLNYRGIIFAACLLNAKIAFSQTLTCQTSCPQPGEVFSMRTSSPVLSSPGAGQVWNFSNISTISPGTHLISYSQASSVPSASLYPQAGLVRTNTNRGVDFLITGSNGVQKASAVNVSVNTQQVELPLPFAYGDTFTQTVISTLVSGSDTFVTTWHNSLSGYASGTLILPSGTSPDVLVVKLYSNWSTTKNGVAYGYAYNKSAYSYYSQNVSHPLFYTMQLSETGPADYFPYTEFLDRVFTGLRVESESDVSSIEVYPSPAADIVNVALPTETGGTLLLMNALGQRLTVQNVTGGACRLDVTGLPEGIYMITFVGEDGMVHEKMVVGR